MATIRAAVGVCRTQKVRHGRTPPARSKIKLYNYMETPTQNDPPVASTDLFGWSDIATAPKDGRYILIRIHNRERQYCEEWERTAWEANAKARWTEHNGGGWVWTGMSGDPVFWRSLPNAIGEARAVAATPPQDQTL